MAPTSVRLPADVEASLDRWSERTRSSRSAVVALALREWLDVQHHPGVVFRDAGDGDRRPALEAGPEIWAVVDTWRRTPQAERTVVAVADVLGLRPDQVETALSYYAEHQAEVDDWLERHHRLAEEAEAAWHRRQALTPA